MENLMQELMDLYNSPNEFMIKKVTNELTTAAKEKRKICTIFDLTYSDCEYFRNLGFTVDGHWNDSEGCQVAVFSGWASDDT